MSATITRPCSCDKPGCRLCQLATKDGRYQRLWGLPVTAPDGAPPGLRTGVCTWLGDENGQVIDVPGCSGCAGKVRPRYCRRFGEAVTVLHQVPEVRACAGCPEFALRQPVPYGGPVVRNLVYHVWPRKGNGVWQRNVAQLLRRIDQFNGRIIVGIATGPGCDPWEHVRDAFLGRATDVVVLPNNPKLREVVTLGPMLDLLYASGRGATANQITFVGHAKGVTHPVNPGVTIHEWARVMYEVCLDHPHIVADVLEKHPCAGAFLKLGKAFHDSSCGWHFSGSFYWLRNVDLFAKDWQRIDQTFAGLETYPGIHWRADEAACLFFQGQVGQMNLYDMGWWKRVAGEYEQWKESRAEPARPNRLAVYDGLFPADLVAQAAAEWPAPDWPGWTARYDSPLERKLAANDWQTMPPACRALLAQMLTLDVNALLAGLPAGTIPDATLYGGGMHTMARGGHLDLHLDCDRHPRLGLERRANAILFLGDWQREWGGAFELHGATRAEVCPLKGRLLVFETTDVSVHGVPLPIQCPPDVQRKSLAVYWWGPPRGPGKRPRAQFVDRPGGAPQPEKEVLRSRRMQLESTP